jgi:radical SAM protein with 4Fe4S-binding SPASM domain
MARLRDRRVPPFWWPPGRVFRQTASAGLIALLAGWYKLPAWMWRHGVHCLPGAGGARGMGCIGFPDHPAWEITARCNLRCIHCHVSGGQAAPDELSTPEAFGLLDRLAEVPAFRMVAFTGGEPLMRPDFFRILEYSQSLGFTHTMATNATLVTPGNAARLKELGVSIAAVSLDSPSAEVHDRIRGVPGAFEKAMRGIGALREAGITLQINVTVMGHTARELHRLFSYLAPLDPALVLVYQMVPLGRGEEIADLALAREQYRELVSCLARWQKEGGMMIEPVAGPVYWASLLDDAGIHRGPRMAAAEALIHGCAAGRGFVYIKPDGRVWPCPFLPLDCGNVRETPFARICRDSPVMAALRDREHRLKGKCGRCDYIRICGGCRGRAFTATGDYLDEDPACFLP